MNSRNKTHENKASHRLLEVNYIKPLTWIGACESQGWIWWPEGSFQACFLWYNTWSHMFPFWCYNRACAHVTGLSGAGYHAGLDEQLVEFCWFLSLCQSVSHWQKCDTETSHPTVGNLSKIGLFIVGLTCANSSAYVFMAHHCVGSSLLLDVQGWLWWKICFQLVLEQNQ